MSQRYLTEGVVAAATLGDCKLMIKVGRCIT